MPKPLLFEGSSVRFGRETASIVLCFGQKIKRNYQKIYGIYRAKNGVPKGGVPKGTSEYSPGNIRTEDCGSDEEPNLDKG